MKKIREWIKKAWAFIMADEEVYITDCDCGRYHKRD